LRSHNHDAHIQRCHRALRGVGDIDAGQWLEDGPNPQRPSWHLRRRLSMSEVALSGCVMRDIRGTPEVDELLAPLRRWLPIGWTE